MQPLLQKNFCKYFILFQVLKNMENGEPNSTDLVDEDNIRDVLEHYKFWFQRELEQYNPDEENRLYTTEDIMKDRIEMINRLAISMEIDIRDTFDEDLSKLMICDICDNAVPPPDYISSHSITRVVQGHYECIEKLEKED